MTNADVPRCARCDHLITGWEEPPGEVVDGKLLCHPCADYVRAQKIARKKGAVLHRGNRNQH
jgi:hypothetical protein